MPDPTITAAGTFLSVVKQLGLLNNYASLILPVMLNAFNFVVTDSARSPWRHSDVGILLEIVIPLSKPVLAVVALFYAVTTYWNSFFPALLYLSAEFR